MGGLVRGWVFGWVGGWVVGEGSQNQIRFYMSITKPNVGGLTRSNVYLLKPLTQKQASRPVGFPSNQPAGFCLWIYSKLVTKFLLVSKFDVKLGSYGMIFKITTCRCVFLFSFRKFSPFACWHSNTQYFSAFFLYSFKTYETGVTGSVAQNECDRCFDQVLTLFLLGSTTDLHDECGARVYQTTKKNDLLQLKLTFYANFPQPCVPEVPFFTRSCINVSCKAVNTPHYLPYYWPIFHTNRGNVMFCVF